MTVDEVQSTGPRTLHPSFHVDGLVAVITGGGTGIGKATTHGLVEAGAKRVYVLGRRIEALQNCKESSCRPSAIIPIVCDVTSKDSLLEAAKQVEEEIGYCNLLFANAGIPEIPRQPLDRSTIETVQRGLWNLDTESYGQMYQVNVVGAFNTAIAFLNLLAEGNRRGTIPQRSQILMTSSVTGITRASYGVFGYPSSKAALSHMAKQLAGILLPHKIRVNVIVAGIYVSEMTDGMLKMMLGGADPCVEGAIAYNCIPMQRAGSNADIVGLVIFLASKAGSYVSGTELVMDGGMLSMPPPWTTPQPPNAS